MEYFSFLPQKQQRGSQFGYAYVKQLAVLTQDETSRLITYLKTTEFETYLLREGIKELTVDDSWKRLILNPTFSSVQRMKDFFIFGKRVKFVGTFCSCFVAVNLFV